MVLFNLKEKRVCLSLKSQTLFEPVDSAYKNTLYAGVACSTVRLLCRRRPTSKLCLLSQVKVPISPMGDAHLRNYIYHSFLKLSIIFYKKYQKSQSTLMNNL